jgi:tRNA nucleotidyltransferase (CCA-adding enzyme)
VLRRLDAAGHRSWIVGGAVRDLLLHRVRAATDLDVATPATPQQVTALFRKVIPTGIEHGTVTVLAGGEAIEVTTFRGEGPYRDGRRPESVTFHTDLEADLARRDFTMNALAFDPIGGEFRDPFGGRRDMARRLVRAVGEPAARFGEDGLRPMRAVRFAAQLGYALDRRTQAAIEPALEVVRRVSVERIADELERLVVAPHADRGVALLRKTGLLGVALPALAASSDPPLDHAIRVLRRVTAEPSRRFAALLHGLDPASVEATLVGLRYARRTVDEATGLVRAHLCRAGRREDSLPAGPEALRRWLSRVGPARVAALLELATAEARALPPARSRLALREVARFAAGIAEVLREAPPLTARDLALDGADVMRILSAGPGAYVGEALRHLLERVLQDPTRNTAEALEAELRWWWAARTPGL